MTKLIARQHLLPSLSWLLERVAVSGMYSTAHLFGKHYSTIEPRIKLPLQVSLCSDLSSSFSSVGRDNLILLDEGGEFVRQLPVSLMKRTVAVEQTTAGMQLNWSCPAVLVCRSAAKIMFESQVIARGILRKLDSLGMLDGRVVGVIGLGALGSEIARALLARGVPTYATDPNRAPADLAPIRVEVDHLLRSAEIVLGCSGQDALSGYDLESVSGRKVFASCSSTDIEFSSILRLLPAAGRFADAKGWVGRFHCTILNGGFPINFDRVREWELAEEILLTRMLVLEGLKQALSLIGSEPRGVMLDPAAQLMTVNKWLDQLPDRACIRLPCDLTEAYFRKHSEGECQVNGGSKYKLHSTTPTALERMRSHHLPYETDVHGLRILVLPGVWSPAYDWSSLFYVENLLDMRGLDVLEIGCGTGVIALHAARAGAGRVVAVDINPEAVTNTRLNFERSGVLVGEVFQSDGFECVTGSYDVVVWNAPYHGARPADMLERACADEEYRDIRSFFRNVSRYVKPGGTILFGFSESGDLPLIVKLIEENGLQVKRKLSEWREGYNCILFELTNSEHYRHFDRQ